jgi:dihydropyrimidinase
VGSGQAAALAGGTTMVIDFALPTNHDLERGYEEYVLKARKSVMDYGLHMAVTRFDIKVRLSS